MKKRLSVLLTAALLLAALTACGSNTSGSASDISQSSEENVQESEPAEDDEENYDTGDASLDDPRNGDEIGENELLVVSFGTSYNDNRRLTIGAIEKAMEDAFPQWSIRRGFTSQIIIDHVLRRDGIAIDNVGEALDRAVENGVKNLVIQPTHLMNGFEYKDLAEEAAQYADAFEAIAIGEPLLTSDEDFAAVAKAVVEATAEYDDGSTAIVLMGHGTEAESNGVYAKMQKVLTDAGNINYFVGTVEAEPSLDDVLAVVKAGEYSRVVLRPLMVVAGDHASNDMAGDDEDSWKSAFEGAGYDVVCLVNGLGEMEAVRQLFVQHAQAAVDSLGQASSEAASGGRDAGETNLQAQGSGQAGAAETALQADTSEKSGKMVYGNSIKDGAYEIAVDSSSSMFNIESCTLTVKNGQMTADMTMGGTGYLYVYMGSGEEAATAGEDSYIPFEVNEKGAHTFTVPVKALNSEIACAAFSKKKETWYDRTLVFRGDSLPADAFAEGAFPTAESLGLEDGNYTVEVSLSGGSGRAGVESPAQMTVEGGTAMVTIVWSSSNYDYMKVDGVTYDPAAVEGNSAFLIPVPYFDAPLPVQADTVAMSTPHEIEYALYFDSSTIQAQS